MTRALALQPDLQGPNKTVFCMRTAIGDFGGTVIVVDSVTKNFKTYVLRKDRLVEAHDPGLGDNISLAKEFNDLQAAPYSITAQTVDGKPVKGFNYIAYIDQLGAITAILDTDSQKCLTGPDMTVLAKDNLSRVLRPVVAPDTFTMICFSGEGSQIEIPLTLTRGIFLSTGYC